MLNSLIAEMIQCASGLNLSESTVERAVRDRMKQCQIDDRASYLERIHDGIELAALVELVVVHETWLFRDPEAFAAASDFVQKRLPSMNRPLRILSIPCSSGEEPYSIAMALLDAEISPARVQIEGMDISLEVLEDARRGVYGRNAFRSRDLSFRDRYFSPGQQVYELHARVRDMVRFSQGNLLTCDTNEMAGAFDIIFCRNLLIYFDEPTQQAAISNLRLLLQDDGLLFAGYAEVPVFFKQGFAVAGYPKSFALRKKLTPVASVIPAPAQPRALKARAVSAKADQPAPLKPTAPRTAATLATRAQATLGAPLEGGMGALLAQARVLADLGDVDGASAILASYLKGVPDSAEAYFLLGLTSERGGDLDAAQVHLRRAIYLNPDHYDALCHLALLVEQSGNADTAASLKDRAARVFRRRSETQARGST